MRPIDGRRAGRRLGGVGVAATGLCILVGCGVHAQDEPEPLDARTAGPAPTPTLTVQSDVPDDADSRTGVRPPVTRRSIPGAATSASPAPPSHCGNGS